MTPALDILRNSWRIYRANGQLIVGYAAWLLLTAAAFVLASFIGNDVARGSVLFAVQIADLMLWFWVGIIVTRLTVAAVADKKPDPISLTRDAWTLVFPLAWAGALQGLATLGGLLLFIIPGFIFLVWFAYAQQAVVIEGKFGLEALAESRSLCRDRFFTAAWYLFVGPFLVMTVYIVVLSVIFALIAAATHAPIETLFGDQPPLWMDMTASLGEIFLMPLLYVYWALSYLELKKTRIVAV